MRDKKNTRKMDVVWAVAGALSALVAATVYCAIKSAGPLVMGSPFESACYGEGEYPAL